MNATKVWKRVISMIMSILLVVGMIPLTELMTVDTYAATNPQVLYLQPNSNWTQDGARFAAYFFGNGEKWVNMTDYNGDGVYEVAVPSGYPSVIFCRMNPSTADNNWNNGVKWNQSSDLTVPSDGKTMYTVASGTWDKGGGSWSTPSSNYYVAGSAGLCGEEWDKSADQMTHNADGTYSITFSDVAAGSYECKVTDGSWDHAWGANGGSNNYSLSVTEKSDVTITFNPATKEITFSTVAVVPETYTVVGDSGLTGSDWDGADTSNLMTDNGDGTYSITYYNVVTGSYNMKVWKNGDYAQGEWPAGYGINHVVEVTKTSNVTVTFNSSTGEITHSIETLNVPLDYDRIDEVTSLSSNQVFYVNVDIVDYLNDNRVGNHETGNYYTDNQGEKTANQEAPYSYFNDALSLKANSAGYQYPLYFGPLHFVGSRYGRTVNNSDWHSLNKWNAAANVALAQKDADGALNTDAVVQGLVHNRLVNGNLADPSKTTVELPYFSQSAAESMKNQAGDYKVMDYYANLQFPFIATYNEQTRVTKYSYDSATDYAVYYDYTNPQLFFSNTHVKDTNNNSGFYPLNEGDDADHEVNNGFGMKFTVDFTVGDKGILADKTPVTFEFTGDDDVWVFIDGVLILDMGGAHAKATGKIDFSTLTATVTDAAHVSDYDSSKVSGNSYDVGAVDNKGLANYIYRTSTPEERAALAADEASVSFANLGISNFDYSAVHTMTVFYMERGMLESNFKMEFTMVPVPSGMTLSKELNNSDINVGILDEVSAVEDYTFTMSATSPSDVSVAFPQFTLTEKNTGLATLAEPTNTSTSGKKYTATLNGITNDTYAHSFRTTNGQDAFIPGTSFSITETTKGVFQYSSTTWAVYDAKNGYASVKSGSGNVANFTLGQTTDTVAQSYAVAFHNNMKVGNLSITKTYGDQLLPDYNTRDFVFTLKLDLDGTGAAFGSKVAYADMAYTINGDDTVYYTDKNGQFTMKHNQTVTFSGIPAGATYEIIEAESNLYYVSASSELEGTIGTNTTVAESITNKTTAYAIPNKVIYITKDVSTIYAPDGFDADVKNVTVTSGNLTVTGGKNSFTVVGNAVGKAGYEYSGVRSDGAYVSGTVTVYVYEATPETYVFDFGLSSNLADTEYGSGLFEDGTYSITGDGTSAILISVTGSGNTQTAITFSGNPTIKNGGCSAAVTFTPKAFMSQVESYTYTVYVLASGVTKTAFVNSEFDPELGTVASSTVRVMPANSVYYEDNFNISGSNSTQKIMFSANAPTKAPNMSQSNDQSANYGYDGCYKDGYGLSGGSSVTLTGTYVNSKGTLVQGQYAYFTFTGTGFDLMSNTDATAAGLAVYVFEADGYSANDLEYVTDVSYKGSTSTLAKTVFVNNYYNNGSLKQVPVVSVRLSARKTYTVYVQAISTSYGTKVTIDGLRIYNPLGDTSEYLATEENTTVDELRALFLNKGQINGKVSLASRIGSTVGVGIAKACTLLENMEGANYSQFLESKAGEPTTEDLKEVYFHGPNNEMYLPDEFGIQFSYKVSSTNWSLQLGAKALGSSKTVSVYARQSGSRYALVDTITVESTTDMYYDLTEMLSKNDKYNQSGQIYDIIIISDSEDSQSNFVSLTTVKHSGITLT